MSELTHEDRHLLRVCVERYIADLRTACHEDQGTPDGQPGTVGHTMQGTLRDLLAKLT